MLVNFQNQYSIYSKRLKIFNIHGTIFSDNWANRYKFSTRKQSIHVLKQSPTPPKSLTLIFILCNITIILLFHQIKLLAFFLIKSYMYLKQSRGIKEILLIIHHKELGILHLCTPTHLSHFHPKFSFLDEILMKFATVTAHVHVHVYVQV